MSDALLAPPPAVELVGIDKSFGPVRANKKVTLEIAKGTIHGIVGENGAGKSTLMSILYGFYEADAGEIRIDGRSLRIANSQAAIKAGIGMVFQHFMLVDELSVIENVMLGAEGGALLATGRRQGARRASKALPRITASPSIPTPGSAISRSASNSASRSSRRFIAVPMCWCSMSRPRCSLRPRRPRFSSCSPR